MKRRNWKNSKLTPLLVLICLLISICAFSGTALALPVEEVALNNVVNYYENHNDGELAGWWEWVGVASCTNDLVTITHDLGSFVPSSNTDSPIGTIIAKLIRGKDITAEATAIADKIEDGTYATPNDLPWAIIAVDAANRGEATPIATYTKATALEKFADWQKADGGFDFNPNTTGTGDVDVTAVVAIALAPYKDDVNYQGVVNNIKTFLAASQNADGSFSSSDIVYGEDTLPGSPNANTTAMAICALEALGEDSLTWHGTASIISPVTALLSYQLADGGFKFVSSDTASNAYATKQAALALGDAVNSRSFLNTLQKNTTEYFTVTLNIDNGTPQPLLVKRSVPKNDTLADAANVAWGASGLEGSFEPAGKEYYLNNTSALSTTEITADSSVLIIPDLTVEALKKDYIGYFNKTTETINVGGTVTLNLKGKTAIDAVSGDNIAYSYITVNGVAGFDYTDGDGNVTLTFVNEGTYIISANNPKASAYGADSGDKISRPYCKVVVKAIEPYSVNVSLRVEGKTANHIYEPNLTVSGNGTKAITALDALYAAVENDADIDFAWGMLNGVKGESPNYYGEGSYYAFYYNNAYAMLGLSNQPINDNDSILVVYGTDSTEYGVAVAQPERQIDGSCKLTFTLNAVALEGATVIWDGTPLAGVTDASGVYTVPKELATIGNHTVQISKNDVNGVPVLVRLTPNYKVVVGTALAEDATESIANNSASEVALVLPEGVTSADINITGLTDNTTYKSATLPAINVVNEQTTGNALSMEIAAGTLVSSFDDTWDGTIQLPTVTNASVTGQTVQKAISVGVAGQTLDFSKPVRLVIPGAANYKVGFLKTDGSLQEITTVLANDNINAATAALVGGIKEAKIAVGSDMVVWTNHFTSFVSYTTPTPSGGGSTQQVHISVKNPKGQTYLSKKSYTFESGMTPLSLLEKTGLDIDVSGNYVVAIEGLAEKSAGYPNSGWMYKVGSKFPTIASSSYKLEASDYVQWLYSYDLGKDLGADYKEEEQIKPEDNAQTGKASFKDVAEKHWAHDHIYYLANKGIIKGKTADTYAPSSNMTRAEFVTVLARMSGADLTKYTAASYLDVKSNAWYISAVAWASKVGVAGGTDGKFNPNANITREEMAAMISRYVTKIAKYTLPETNPAANFADSAEISSFAKEAVTVMQKAGIINGMGENKFAPQNPATRGEAAKMLAVLLQDIEKAAK